MCVLQGEKLLGVSADELHRLKESGEESQVAEIYQNALFKTYVFSVL